MRKPTEAEIRRITEFLDEAWNLLNYEETENDVRRALRGVIDDYQSWHPGYAGKLAVLIWSEPCFVNIVTFDEDTPDDVLAGELLGLGEYSRRDEPLFFVTRSKSYVPLRQLITSNVSNGEIGFTPSELRRLCTMEQNEVLLCGGGAFADTIIRRVR